MGGGTFANRLIEIYKNGWSEQPPKRVVSIKNKLDFIINGNPGYSRYKSAEEGWLFVALMENARCRNDKGLILKLQNLFENHILNNEVQNIHEAVNGLFAIRLYEQLKVPEYKAFADKTYQWLNHHYINDKGILYGIKDLPGVDGYGMSVPFLTAYSYAFNCNEAKEMALHNIECWIKMGGVNPLTGFPYMAISLAHPSLPSGYSNWGRGTAWWVIGLSDIDKNSLSPEYSAYVEKLEENLTEIWLKEHKFTQLLHQSDKIDLSATLPIIYYLHKKGLIEITKSDIDDISRYYENGALACSSGPNDGYSLSPYSGRNPLADAFLLKIINECF